MYSLLSQYTPVPKATAKAPPVDELEAFYATLGDVSKTVPPIHASRASIFSLPNPSEPAVVPPVIQDLPSLPTAAKLDDAQRAGIAAARAAEQLAKAEDRKRKAAPPSIGIGGGGKKVNRGLSMSFSQKNAFVLQCLKAAFMPLSELLFYVSMWCRFPTTCRNGQQNRSNYTQATRWLPRPRLWLR